jgi:hypothetical protein
MGGAKRIQHTGTTVRARGRVLRGPDGRLPAPPATAGTRVPETGPSPGFAAGTMARCAGPSRHDVPPCRPDLLSGGSNTDLTGAQPSMREKAAGWGLDVEAI